MNKFVDFGYAGKTVVISGGGGAGMGAALARLLSEFGADVHVLDVREGQSGTFHYADLSDPEAISAAADSIEGPIFALFNCVGIPGNRGSVLDVMMINFAGVRHLTDCLLPRIEPGGSVTNVASQAASAWVSSVDRWLPLVDTDGFVAAKEWCTEAEQSIEWSYVASKEALVVWTMRQVVNFGERGVRINAILPGPTATPMTADFETMMGKRFWNEFPLPLGRPQTSDEQASVMAFLGSPLAASVTGAALLSDGGATAALVTGTVEPPTIGGDAS